MKREEAEHGPVAPADARRCGGSIDELQSRSPAATADVRSVLVGILLATFLAALDQTVVAAALPTIGRELGDFELLPWVVTIYLLTATAVTQLYGKAADIYGRRAALLLAIGIFMVGSVGCALAPTMPILVAARGVQGLGAGGLLSLSQTIVGDLVAPRERGRYQAHFSIAWAAASLAGPVVGGVFAEHLSWTLVFWINLPIGLAALLLTNTQLKRLPHHERPHKLDFIGAALMTVATVAFLLALSWGGVRYSWTSTPILALLAAAAVVAGLFVLRLRSAPEPLIPTEILVNPIVICATLAMSLTVGTFIGMIVFVPVYLQIVVGLSASSAGAALIPVVLGTVVGAVLAGRIMQAVEHYKWTTIAGLAFSVCAVAVLATSPGELPLGLVEVLLATASLGIGTTIPVAGASIQNVVAPHQLGSATASFNFFRQLAGALAVAALGAVVFGSDAHVGLGLHGLGGFHEIRGDGAEFLQRFRIAFMMMAATLAIAVATVLLMEEKPLRSGRLDGQIDA